jgi:hypothetical protein
MLLELFGGLSVAAFRIDEINSRRAPFLAAARARILGEE